MFKTNSLTESQSEGQSVGVIPQPQGLDSLGGTGCETGKTSPFEAIEKPREPSPEGPQITLSPEIWKECWYIGSHEAAKTHQKAYTDPMWQLSRTCLNVAISALIQDWGLDAVDPSRHYHGSRNRNSKLVLHSRLTGQMERMASGNPSHLWSSLLKGQGDLRVGGCVRANTWRSEHVYDVRIYMYTIRIYMHTYIS